MSLLRPKTVDHRRAELVGKPVDASEGSYSGGGVLKTSSSASSASCAMTCPADEDAVPTLPLLALRLDPSGDNPDESGLANTTASVTVFRGDCDRPVFFDFDLLTC